MNEPTDSVPDQFLYALYKATRQSMQDAEACMRGFENEYGYPHDEAQKCEDRYQRELQ